MKCNVRIICPVCSKIQRVEVDCLGEEMRYQDVKYVCEFCDTELLVHDSEEV